MANARAEEVYKSPLWFYTSWHPNGSRATSVVLKSERHLNKRGHTLGYGFFPVPCHILMKERSGFVSAREIATDCF